MVQYPRVKQNDYAMLCASFVGCAMDIDHPWHFHFARLKAGAIGAILSFVIPSVKTSLIEN